VPKVPQRFLRRTWVRRALPAGVAAALVVAGTAVTRANANSNPIDTYRTTTVTNGSVEQRLNVTGTVQRVNQVSQGFAVAGKVTSVPVSVGDTVTTGQTLATIDPRPLQSAVTTAQASLAKAKATLESDQTSTATSGTGGTSGTASATTVTPAPTTTATVSPRVASPSGRSGAAGSQSIAQVQKRVASAQAAITADLARASAALARCLPFFPSEPSPSGTSPAPAPTTPSTSLPSTGGPAPTRATTPTTTTPPSDAAIKACLGALRTAPTQQQIQRDQQALTRSQTDLMTSVTLAITTAGTSKATSTASSSAATGQSSTSRSSTSQSAASQSSGGQSSGGQSSGAQSSGGQSSGAQSSGGQNGGAGQSGASRVISDQAAVTTAEGALSSAQTNLTSATMKSSIAGTVGSVTLVTGTSSSGLSIVIVGSGAVEVTVKVPLASMASVRVGQKASVTPQGATSSVPGSVTSISLLPSTSTSTSGTSAGRTTTQSAGTGQGSATSSSPVYPVVVLVPDALPALASGSRADVSLLVGTAFNVLAVPNSALTPVRKGQALALTLKNGVATRALVKTGYAGTLTTQVTSGLTAGQQVVLADLSTALPTNTTNARRFGVGGGAAGGFGGSGLGSAGLGGAGLGGGATSGGGFPSRG